MAGPEDFMSRDTDGFMHKITDLMDDDVLVVAPGQKPRLKVPVKYVGHNAEKHDNVAGTGLNWQQGETLPVDADAAEKLLLYPDVWVYDPDFVDTYTVAPDGSAVLEYRASPEEVQAILEGRAELRVVAIDSGVQSGEQAEILGANNAAMVPADPVESVMAMTKDDLVAFGQSQFGVKLDKRKSVDDLRQQVIEMIHTARDE